MTGLFQRLADLNRSTIEITIDGEKVTALDGDTVLTVILLQSNHLRPQEISGESRAGFCLMGVCQDCWVSDKSGKRLRACTTYVRPGLDIVTDRFPQMMATDEEAT